MAMRVLPHVVTAASQTETLSSDETKDSHSYIWVCRCNSSCDVLTVLVDVAVGESTHDI